MIRVPTRWRKATCTFTFKSLVKIYGAGARPKQRQKNRDMQKYPPLSFNLHVKSPFFTISRWDKLVHFFQVSDRRFALIFTFTKNIIPLKLFSILKLYTYLFYYNLHKKGFQSLTILLLLLSNWNLISLKVSPDSIDREREFDYPLQMLIYPDLQSEPPKPCKSDLAKIILYTSAWAYSNSFLGIRDKILLRKVSLAIVVFTLVPVIPFA